MAQNIWNIENIPNNTGIEKHALHQQSGMQNKGEAASIQLDISQKLPVDM